jgi:heptosyltransferase-2
MEKILVIAPNWIGDAAMCTPALRALHRRFPRAEITVAARAAVADLLRGLPYISRIEVMPPKSDWRGMIGAAWRLHPYAHDLAVLFPHSFRAALLARLASSRRRIGYDRDRRGVLLTERVPPYREQGKITPIYMAREYLDLVAPLGCVDDGEGLELHAAPEPVAFADGLFTGDGPRVGIAPGAAFGPSKLWPAERYAAVADSLEEDLGAQCLLLTGPGEESVRDAVMATAKRPLLRYDDKRTGIEMLKAAISRLDLLICNDSGTRHIAVAFKVPTVCIMGPTSPAYSNGPYERGKVLRIDVDCGPCQKPVCVTDHRCMTGISVNCVLDAVREILRGNLIFGQR